MSVFYSSGMSHSSFTTEYMSEDESDQENTSRYTSLFKKNVSQENSSFHQQPIHLRHNPYSPDRKDYHNHSRNNMNMGSSHNQARGTNSVGGKIK